MSVLGNNDGWMMQLLTGVAAQQAFKAYIFHCFIPQYSRYSSIHAVSMSLAYLQQESTAVQPDAIWSLAWTAQNQVITACADGHLRIHDPTQLNTAPVHDLAAHPLAISSLSANASGSRTISVSLDGTAVLACPTEGTILGHLGTGQKHASAAAYTAALHPETKAWAWSGRSSQVAISSIDSSEALTSDVSMVDTGKGKFGMDLQFSPDGNSLALATESGHIVVIDVETAAVTATYTSHAMSARTVAWSGDSQLYSGSDDHRIVLHDVRAGSGAVAIMQGHQGWVLDVAPNPDGKLLGSGSADGTIKLWDVGQRTCVSTNTTSATVWGFAWQPIPSETFSAGKQFVTAGDDKAATLYRAAGAV